MLHMDAKQILNDAPAIDIHFTSNLALKCISLQQWSWADPDIFLVFIIIHGLLKGVP